MTSTLVRRLLQLAPVIAAFALVLGDSKPAAADIACFQNLRGCYARAAFTDSYWDMWLMGMDCELAFTDCTRRAVVGR